MIKMNNGDDEIRGWVRISEQETMHMVIVIDKVW